jgi:hypothetical protein
MRRFLCTGLIMCFLMSQAIAYACDGTGMIVATDVQCCGEQVASRGCQGFTEKCDPIDTWKQCQGTQCMVGVAGCQNSDAVTALKTPSPSFSNAGFSNGRFRESLCGQGFNSWLDGKLAMKNMVQPRLAIGR